MRLQQEEFTVDQSHTAIPRRQLPSLVVLIEHLGHHLAVDGDRIDRLF
jgi:hypothetical protein